MKKIYYIKNIRTNEALDWYSGTYFFTSLENQCRNGQFDSEEEALNGLDNAKDDIGDIKVTIDYYIEFS